MISTTRRSLITLGSGLAMDLVLERPAAAQIPSTPEKALQELMAGNQRFASNQLTHHEHDLEILKAHTVEKQEPFAAILSCADSRVPIELVFDQSIGHLFVTRIAGNVVSPEIIASLEYGAAVLGTKVILVIGHTSCGAVKATMDSTGVPGQISALYPRIQQAVDQAGPNLDAAIRANAKIQAALLRKSSTVVAGLLKEKKLLVKAAYYDLGSGKVTLLE
jgi:carbonic anhydrase